MAQICPLVDSAESQNYNRYGYVLNNPLRYNDPSGEIYYNVSQPLPSMGSIDIGRLGVSSGGGFGSSGEGGSSSNGVTNNGNIYVIGAALLANSPDDKSTTWNNMGDGYFYSQGIGSVNFSGDFFAGDFYGGRILPEVIIYRNRSDSYNASIIQNHYNNNNRNAQGGGGGVDWGYIGNVLGAGGTAFAGLENAIANKYWWMDARGNYNSTRILEVGENGRYVRGVQGLRNGYSSALKAANGYKVAGSALGVLSLGVTYMQYREGQISGTEASIDAAFGVIGFMGPIGAGISGTYFIGKIGYEYFSGNTLFEKPR